MQTIISDPSPPLSCLTVAKTAKMLGARLKLQRKEDEDDEDEHDNEDRDQRWGANKRQYYGADTVDLEVGWMRMGRIVHGK